LKYWLRNIVAYLIAAIACAAVIDWIGSSLIGKTLIPNLSTIVLALLAINVQTTAVIAVKLRELADRAGSGAARSVREFRVAIYEQAGLAIAAFALQATVDSTALQLSQTTLAVASLFVLIAALHIFVDTTIGLLIALVPADQ